MKKLLAAFSITLLAIPAAAFAAYDVDLKQGMSGTAVIELQNFLIGKGYLAAGNSTGYFGALTLAGVKAFQTAKGIQPVSGFFGPLTRAAAKAIGTGCDGCMPSPMDTATQIKLLLQQVEALRAQIAQLKSGSITTVSSTFSVTPTSGTVPLAVTANFEKNSSCGQYSVTWGDGTSSISPAPLPTTDCLSAFFPVALTHTYLTPGTYTVTHDSLYTEPVSRTVTVQVASTNPSFTASPTSVAVSSVGTSHFVYFYTNVSEGAVDFGDGTSAAVEPNCTASHSSTGTAGDSCNNNGKYFTIHSYNQAGTYTAKLMNNLVDCNSQNPTCNVVGTVTITVTGTTTSSPLIYTDKTSYNAGEAIKVIWNNPATPGASDWIGMVKAGQNWIPITGGQQGITWQWVNGISGGFANLVAPAASGNYQIVYFKNTADGAVNTSTEMSRTSAFINYGGLVETN
jgi:peptidoglycan hydrolase-like protein with peptidoglycan-binding domain